jgi:heat shock protein HslJ
MRNSIATKKWPICRIAAEDAYDSGDGGGDADAVTDAYRASGSEPYWSLTMSDGQMAFASADGTDVTVATPEPQSTRTGPLYETPEMTVHINNFRRCQGADGREYRDTVRVTVGTRTVQGCGGEAVEAK